MKYKIIIPTIVITIIAGTIFTLPLLPIKKEQKERKNTTPITFEIPIDCNIGKDCFIQKYVDTDSSDEYRDHTCGLLTSPNHKGTDFRLRDYVALEKGVAVQAAADGIVSAHRDGVRDINIRFNKEYDSKQGCGNVVIINHGSGWNSWYCHMKNGSVTVKKGDKVTAGQKLGLVGLSGETEYPHLHFQVSYYDKIIDPFTTKSIGTGCQTSTPVNSLWSDNALSKLEYNNGHLLISGITNEDINSEKARNGKSNGTNFLANSDNIFIWADVTAPRKGDTLRFTIKQPDQEPQTYTRIFGKSKAVMFDAIKLRKGGDIFSRGKYFVTIQMTRNNTGGTLETVFEKKYEFTIK